VFHATSLGLLDSGGSLTGSCGDNPGIACRLTWDLTHSANAAQVVRVYHARDCGSRSSSCWRFCSGTSCTG
jgi:hypothetical protein